MTEQHKPLKLTTDKPGYIGSRASQRPVEKITRNPTSDATNHNHGVNPDCSKFRDDPDVEGCEGSGVYRVYQGDGYWEEYNCDCTENCCDCDSCRERLVSPGVDGCEYCEAQRIAVALERA